MAGTQEWNGLVDDLQTELNDARFKGAGDGAAAAAGHRLRAKIRCGARSAGGSAATRTAGQVQVGVVGDVVQLLSEFDLDSVVHRAELLVDVDIPLVEGHRASKVLGQAAKRARQSVGGGVGIAGVGCRQC